MRVAKARREGNVPRSSELVAAAAFGAAAISACAVIQPIGALARDALFAASSGRPARHAELLLIALALLPLGAGACFAFGTGIAQSGFAPAPVSLKVERLNPFEGARRLFSRETALHAVRGTLAFAAATAALVPAVGSAVLSATDAGGIGGVASAAWIGARRELFIACAVGLLFAAAEYGIARDGWLRKLRMSFEELKREIKEQEGDPQMRGRRRTQHRDLSRGAISKVSEAALIVTNPTHVAIALGYDPPAVPVPVLLVCACDVLALRVQEIALACGIPVVEDRALARALLSSGRVGAPIAAEHYVAVAEIIVALGRQARLAK